MNEMQGEHEPTVLVRRAKAGDRQAFARLYELYFTPVYRYIYFRVKSRAEAEDIAQTVFLRAFQAMPRFEERGKPPLAFFFTVARNAVHNFWRKKKDVSLDDPEKVFDSLPSHGAGPEETAYRREAAASVRRALRRLTADQQEVIVLRYINELSHHEIAEIMGKSEAAIRQLHSRGLRAARKSMK